MNQQLQQWAGCQKCSVNLLHQPVLHREPAGQFTYGETEPQRGPRTYPKSQSQFMAKPGLCMYEGQLYVELPVQNTV